MKLLHVVLLMSAALSAVAQGDAGYPGFPETGILDEAMESKANLRRSLLATADGSGGGTTTPAPSPSPTPAPTPSPTPAPASPSPSPSPVVTPSPSPSTAAPTTPSPSPETTTTPSPSPTPATGSTSSSATPTPVTTPAPSSTNAASGNEERTPTPNSASILDGSSGSSRTTSSTTTTRTPTPTESGSTSTNSDSKMSTGTVVGIVAGIIGGVAILAFVTMTMIRRKRDNDDDPLSPFELSMDKGYNGVQGYGGQNAAGNGYNNNARGNAPVENDQQLNTDTPPANAIAAGVAYSQFYDVQTSPGSGHNQQRRVSSDYHEETQASNATNLWMSAMELKDNESYLSAKESHDDDSLHSGGRNSYDVGYHDDQSSQISGNSDLNSTKDFPDYEDESARGSYEL